MAGSLSHITDEHGEFTLDLIENGGDAAEALVECFAVIQALSGGSREIISAVCIGLGFPDPYRKRDSAGDDE
jgi:hypothetical protein